MIIKCPKCGKEELVAQDSGTAITMQCNCGEIYETPLTKGTIRQFTTGATRDTDEGKYDYEGFLSPSVIERYGAYMNKHRKQADGKLRASDNWQHGIPKDAYMKSMWRHFLDAWFIHRGYKRFDKQRNEEITLDEAFCAILFNVMGYLYEILKEIKNEL
jgi:hypothetical protein